jgi:hypothetical protein
MLDILFEAEQLLTMKREQFLGNSKGRLREVLERIWIDKFKWGKMNTCCRLGMYDDLKEELESLGFYVYYEMYYGEKMFCISLK